MGMMFSDYDEHDWASDLSHEETKNKKLQEENKKLREELEAQKDVMRQIRQVIEVSHGEIAEEIATILKGNCDHNYYPIVKDVSYKYWKCDICGHVKDI